MGFLDTDTRNLELLGFVGSVESEEILKLLTAYLVADARKGLEMMFQFGKILDKFK